MVVSIIMRIIITYQNANKSNNYNLTDDGITIIPNFISTDDIKNIKTMINNDEIVNVKKYIINSVNSQQQIKQLFGDDYEFHDYIFLIKKSQFHTCHRDYNGDFFNKDQKYPSYTIIIYLEDMNKCLDVIPTSHKSKDAYNYNLTDYTQTVYCKQGDAILFNANLIHNGSLHETDNGYMRIQMKISNKVDHEVLNFYNNYNKMLNSENNTPNSIQYAQKHISCQFPAISSLIKQYDFNKDSNATATLQYSSIFANIFSNAFAILEDVV